MRRVMGRLAAAFRSRRRTAVGESASERLADTAAMPETPPDELSPAAQRLRLAAAQEIRALQRGEARTASPQARRSGSAPASPVAPAGTATVPNWADADLETPEQRGRRRSRQRVDEAIADAQRRGEFDNLRGKGKPIPAELLVSSDDAWLAGKTLANAGFLPPWLQLQHEIDDDLQECLRLVERTERFPPFSNHELPSTELRRRLEDVRVKVRRYNLMVPTMSLQRRMPETEDLVQRMARAVQPLLEDTPHER